MLASVEGGRQFEAVEPENRLVARTVETAWEQRLAEQRRAEADLAAQRAHRPSTLTDQEIGWLRRAGADVRRVFDADTTTFRERKQLLRAILDEVVVTIDAETRTAAVVIVWQGGATTELSMTLTKTGGHFRTTDEDTVELVRRLAVHYDDTTIAAILARQHRRTATGLEFTKSRVKSLRISRDIPAFDPAAVAPSDERHGGNRRLPAQGGDHDAVPMFTVKGAAAEPEVDHGTIYRWLRTGFLAGQQLTPGAPWQIPIDQAIRDRIVPQAPEGWLPLEAAAAALGVARQTVLYRVQRGELEAVYLNRGRRKGRRINVSDEQPGLFAQPR